MWKNIVEKLRALATRERLRKLGWYAALAALLTILGLASTAYRNGRMLKYDRNAPAGLTDEVALAAEAPLLTPAPLFALPSPTPEPTPEPMVFMWPVEGEIIGEYAPDGMASGRATPASTSPPPRGRPSPPARRARCARRGRTRCGAM